MGSTEGELRCLQFASLSIRIVLFIGNASKVLQGLVTLTSSTFYKVKQRHTSGVMDNCVTCVELFRILHNKNY